jgi:hypothetical protein
VSEADSNNDGLLDVGDFLTVFAREKQIEAEIDQSVIVRSLSNSERSRANADSASMCGMELRHMQNI